MSRLPFLILLGLSGMAAATETPWRPLLDEKLSAWEKWLGWPHASVTGLPPLAEGAKREKLGLNNDPKNVFTVVMEDGEPVLHVTGEIWGGLTTLESFSNYHLRVQMKWGDARWQPRADTVRDNGICYHANGPHGAGGGNWKKSLEFQVQEKDMGDFWQVAGSRADISAVPVDKKYFYNPTGEKLSFGAGGDSVIKSSVAHLPGDFEKPKGEWNTLNLYVIGGDAMHVVNGTLVLALRNAAAVDGTTKTEKPLTAGQIQIQSESAECFYRRVEIQPITEFPAALKKAAGW